MSRSKKTEEIKLQKKFMVCQIHAIDIDKWFEGLRINHDPSSEYIFNWVRENAQKYRDQWFHSTCMGCPKWETCGWKAVEQCREGDDILTDVMIDLFKKQYYNQQTVGGHSSGCEKSTIHYFVSYLEKDEVIMRVLKSEGGFDDLIKEITDTYKCISVVIGIPFLIKKSEEHISIIKDYLEENQWI